MSEGKYLKLTRKSAGYTQTELAVKLGFGSGQFCSNWERGISSLPPSSMKLFIKLTKSDPEQLVKVKSLAYKKWLRSYL